MLLVVEDSPSDARLLKEMFKEDGTNSAVITQVGTMEAAERHLATSAVDIVLLDLGLPDAQGLESVRRAHAAAPAMPLVVLSGLDDERIAVEALQDGAQDYLIKGQIDLRSLLRALRYAIERKSLESAARALSEKVETARMEAEAATAAKTTFLANMSHEIRTPLNSIIGFSDLLLDDVSLNAVQRRYLDLIKNAGGALLTVVNDILDFSKLNAGKVELTREPFSLDALIRSTVSIVEGSAEAKGLNLLVQIDPDLSQYNCGDLARIRQVLLNLLSNAVKFTATGHVALAISKIPAETSLECLRFTICDTGSGVPSGNQFQIFEQFAQADLSVNRQHGGTGLGLSICKSLVGLMGGRIGFFNNEDVGATFWFEIELESVASDLVKTPPCPDLGDQPGARILLVEDLPVNQELAYTILKRAGHAVDIASDGIEAVAAVEKNSYDVILMDIQMPRMDGVTATKKIRKLASPACKIPIIAMTANALPEQIREFRQAGMDHHLTKPFKQNDLHEAIRRAIDLPTASNPENYPPPPDDAIASGPGGIGASENRDSAIFDPVVLAAVQRFIPGDRVNAYLQGLDREFRALINSPLGDPSLECQAHKIVSKAGMLGLTRMSKGAQALESACRSGVALAAALRGCRAAVEDVRLFALPAANSPEDHG